jgi:hypothetical protein
MRCALLHNDYFTARISGLYYPRFKIRGDVSVSKIRREKVLRITCSATHCYLFIYVSVASMSRQGKEQATRASEFISFTHRK